MLTIIKELTLIIKEKREMKPILLIYTIPDCLLSQQLTQHIDFIKEQTRDFVSEVVMEKTDWNVDCQEALRSSIVEYPSVLLINADDYHSKSSTMRHSICPESQTALNVIKWVRDHQFGSLFNNSPDLNSSADEMKPVLVLYTADKCCSSKMFKPRWIGIC